MFFYLIVEEITFYTLIIKILDIDLRVTSYRLK